MPNSYATLEQVILSDQMSPAQVEDLLRRDPEFAEWYRARARQRQEATR